MESKLNLDFKLVEQARAHAAQVADETQRFIDGYTTVAVERTICRLLGIDGVSGGEALDITGENSLGVPLPSVVVDHLMEKGALSQGAAFWLGNAMVETGKGLEVNTSGYRQGLGKTIPVLWIIRDYYQLGGRVVTLGSDAHQASDLAADFDVAMDILTGVGFRYFAFYRQRQPVMLKLI